MWRIIALSSATTTRGGLWIDIWGWLQVDG